MSTRSLSNTNPEQAATSTPDIQVHGDPGAWECISKASSLEQGWMKSTKRMKVPGGWLYQVTTEHRTAPREMSLDGVIKKFPGSVICCAEAITFVPDPSVDSPDPYVTVKRS